ncbi:MAG: hypothetical protein ACTSRI_09545 [Promethearchaeota archaeon]
MIKEDKKRAPIHVTLADVERAYKKVEQFQRLLKRGKTTEQIFEDLIRLTQVDKKHNSNNF